jgi:quercetin dioxygenase-like cupin family protein
LWIEIEGLVDRPLRMRLVTIDAGGYAGLHDHRNRSTLVYVREGVITDYPAGGGEPKEYAAGQALVEGAGGLPHWVEIKGKTPAVLIAVDLNQV